MQNSDLSLELDNLLQKILSSSFIPREDKERLKGIVEGRFIAPLTGDTMSKRLFSPDTNPERFDFIMQRVMRDPTIKTNESAGNEPPVEFDGSKKVISDLSSWLTDGRYADPSILR